MLFLNYAIYYPVKFIAANPKILSLLLEFIFLPTQPYMIHKKQYFFNNLIKLVYLSVLVLLAGCANIVPPNGGPKDETPPMVLSILPLDSTLNSKPKKITIRTNKYMELSNLENQLHVSPYLPILPTVTSYGKRIEIKLVDSLLQPNTTYKISLGNALVDNREQTPISNFEYIFSTGAYFDSLFLNGQIINMRTGLPDSGMHIFLYDANTNDSAITFSKPAYIGKSKTDGSFTIDLLPNKSFKLLAVNDEDKNLMYSMPAERMAFLDAIVSPLSYADSTIVLYSFVSEYADTLLKKNVGIDKANDRFAKTITKAKTDLPYQVVVDTNIKNRTFGLKDTLLIQLLQHTKKIDQGKVYLSYDNNGIEVEAIYQMKTDSVGIYITTDWQQDKVYTLRLIKGWATDMEDKEFVPNKLSFRTRKNDDYASLKLNIDSLYIKDNYLVEIKKEDETIYLAPIDKASLSLQYLQAGAYQLAIINDENGDRKWTPGDFPKRRHPEQIIHHFSPLALRAGWDNEVDFKAATNLSKSQASDDKFNDRK